MRIDISEFEGVEMERIYMATSVDEATTVEQALETLPFDFTVDIEQYRGGFSGAIGIKKMGLAFLVHPENAEAGKKLLLERGLKQGLEGPQGPGT